MNRFTRKVRHWAHYRTPELAAGILIPLAILVHLLTAEGGWLQQWGL